MFLKINVFKNFAIFTGKHLCCSLCATLKAKFAICKIFKSTFFYRTPLVTASAYYIDRLAVSMTEGPLSAKDSSPGESDNFYLYFPFALLHSMPCSFILHRLLSLFFVVLLMVYLIIHNLIV